MASPPTWQDTYRRQEDTYRRLKDEVLFALKRELDRAGIKVHTLTARVKTLESLEEKASRKGYEQPLSEIHDVVGARVVVLFRSDLPRVAAIVTSVFEVFSSEDKIESATDPTTFGYMSLHYAARLRQDHQGPRYEGLEGVEFEVQVRTLLMDAWANVSHYLAYKGEASIPSELRRDFYALSGLFYVADKHFEMFFDQASAVEQEASYLLAQARDMTSVELNLDTLGAFLRNKYPARKHLDRDGLSELVDELLMFGYQDLNQLEEVLDENKDAFESSEPDRPPDSTTEGYFTDVGVVRISLGLANPAYKTYLRSQAVSNDEDDKDEWADDA